MQALFHGVKYKQQVECDDENQSGNIETQSDHNENQSDDNINQEESGVNQDENNENQEENNENQEENNENPPEDITNQVVNYEEQMVNSNNQLANQLQETMLALPLSPRTIENVHCETCKFLKVSFHILSMYKSYHSNLIITNNFRPVGLKYT